ncbi:MAG: response regulator [Acidobacteria bacterium]|nr:response regulator [Acidobacteriota bacterium]
MGNPVVLVVDDDPAVLDLVGHIAERAGFDVRPCGGGREALEFLESRKAHLAFVDVYMPGVGGIEVLKTIRSTDPECRVVVMSGDAPVETAVEAIKLGAIDFRTKPFDVDRMRGILQTERDEIERRRRVLTQELSPRQGPRVLRDDRPQRRDGRGVRADPPYGAPRAVRAAHR